ncbi:MAG: ASKHA domain-containing protein [Thermoleophilia bacterium]
MNDSMTHTVIFQPGDIVCEGVPHEANLLRVALLEGVHINASCGGTGGCGKCKVRITAGEYEGGKASKISDEDYADGLRLACQVEVHGDLTVEIPEESRMGDAVALTHERRPGPGRVLTPQDLEQLVEGWSVDPVVKKFYLQLEEPDAANNINDLDRVKLALKAQHGIEAASVDFEAIRDLPAALRDGGWTATVTLVETSRGPKVIQVAPGDATAQDYSIVLDIGTTSIHAQLLDLKAGKTIAQASDYNGQISYGEDVISRIVKAQKPEGRKELQQAVIRTVTHVVEKVLEKGGIDRCQVSHMVAAGNTTMTHLMLGVETKNIRISPYVPAATFLPPVRAADIGIDVCDHVHLYTFPCVSSYVGGDIVSGIIGSGVFQTEKVTLYVDIGTNGEAVVGNQEWLVATSCSAGPAFEGGGIKHGMRATRGAIEAVQIDPATGEPNILTISGKKPLGICGSGIIDAVAELLEAGILEQNGKFNRDRAGEWLRQNEDGLWEYVLVKEEFTAGGRQDIVITEPDIDNLMRAKGAIFAGITTLLNSVGMDLEAVEQIYIAGGFGKYLQIDRAAAIGLFPEMDPEKFTFVGNGSLLGARLVSFSKDMLEAGENVARTMTNVELSDNQFFMDEYMAALFFPHTDLKWFPRMAEILDKLDH